MTGSDSSESPVLSWQAGRWGSDLYLGRQTDVRHASIQRCMSCFVLCLYRQNNPTPVDEKWLSSEDEAKEIGEQWVKGDVHA